MRYGRRAVAGIVCMVIGAILFTLGVLDILDSFWSGMGGGMIAVGAVHVVQTLRRRKDEVYREKMETEERDERIRDLRIKAWAWTGYLFILIASVCAIVCKVVGQDLLSIAAGTAVMLIAGLYWVCYLILTKRY